MKPPFSFYTTMDSATFLKACDDGDLDVVRRYISVCRHAHRGHNGRGYTPLMIAVERQDVEMVRIVLPYSNLRALDSSGQAVLTKALFNCFNPTIISMLVPGSDLRQTDDNKQTPLMVAIRIGNIEAIPLLILGSDVSQVDEKGRTVLMQAVASSAMNMVETLLPFCDTWHRTPDGRSIIDFAHDNNASPSMIEVLKKAQIRQIEQERLLLRQSVDVEPTPTKQRARL